MTRVINGKPVSTEPIKALFPFESRFVEIDGFSLHYIDEGRGRPVLMLHGNPPWSFYFRNIVPPLMGRFRCIVPDHIGCGLSDKPSPRAYGYTLDRRVADLDRFIRHLGLTGKISLILHDWGGMIGLAWALANLSRIDRITVTNTSGFLLPKGKKFPLRLAFFKYLTALAVPAVSMFNLFSRGALYTAAKKPLSREAKKGLTAPYNSWKNRVATLKFVQDIPLTPKDRSFKTARHVDENLYTLETVPLQILWGKHDFVFDMHFFNEWRRRFPEAQTYLFEDAGHYLFEDKPGQTAVLIKEFLEKDAISF